MYRIPVLIQQQDGDIVWAFVRATLLRIHFPLKHYQYILILSIVAEEQSKIKKEFLNVIIVDKCYQTVMN